MVVRAVRQAGLGVIVIGLLLAVAASLVPPRPVTAAERLRAEGSGNGLPSVAALCLDVSGPSCVAATGRP